MVCVFMASSVWKGKVGDGQAKPTMAERTLKTRRILLSSIFQLATVSLSSFAWTRRETAFRLLRLMTFLWTSPTVL
jgi:hypothetical protein